MKKILFLIIICTTLIGCGKDTNNTSSTQIKQDTSEVVESASTDVEHTKIQQTIEQVEKQTEEETIVYSENHYGNKETSMDNEEMEDFFIQFNDFIYKIPYRWNSFTHSLYKGYKIPEDEIIMLAPGQCKHITLESELYGKASFVLKNFEAEEMPINQCGVIRVELDTDLNDDVPVFIAKGIYIGVEITEAELIEIYGEPDEKNIQSSNENDLYVSYIWYSDNYETSKYEILLHNNEVVGIIVDASGNNELYN